MFVNFWLGDGYTQKTAFDTYGEETAASLLTVGGEPAQPHSSRTSSAASSAPSQGRRHPRHPAGDHGGATPAVRPERRRRAGRQGTSATTTRCSSSPTCSTPSRSPAPDGDAAVPSWAPKIVFEKGGPSAFDFAGSPKPDKELRVGALIKGTGDEVAKGDLILVDYLGQVYGGEKPFDESFTKRAAPHADRPRRVVKGWDQGLVGETVGSRVLLRIPPDGYGDRAPGETSRRTRRCTSSSTSSPPSDGPGPRHPSESAMSAAKTERLMNLLIMLLVQTRLVAKERIREILYPDATAEGFERMFERDKEELRSLGVPIRSARWTPTSTTSPATGSAPTSSPCRRSTWRRRGGGRRAGHPRVGAPAPRPRHHRGGPQAHRRRRRHRRQRPRDRPAPADGRRAGVRRVLRGDPRAFGRRVRLLAHRPGGPRPPPPPTVGGHPLLRTLVRRRLRPRPRRRARLPALPRPGRGAAGSAGPVPTHPGRHRHLGGHPAARPAQADAVVVLARTATALPLRRAADTVETDVPGPDAHAAGTGSPSPAPRSAWPTRCSASAPTCTSRRRPRCASRSSAASAAAGRVEPCPPRSPAPRSRSPGCSPWCPTCTRAAPSASPRPPPPWASRRGAAPRSQGPLHVRPARRLPRRADRRRPRRPPGRRRRCTATA